LPNLWRISQYVDLEGKGGLKSDGRWHRRGRRVVYLGESVAGVVLERLVHLMDDRKLPAGLQLISVDYPQSLECEEVLDTHLPNDWQANIETTQDAGDLWLQQRKTALLKVPSAVTPRTTNFLLNPEHSDWHLVKPAEYFRFDFDTRLKKLADSALSYGEEIRFVSPDE
jgi:RES domain-containing protein